MSSIDTSAVVALTSEDVDSPLYIDSVENVINYSERILSSL